MMKININNDNNTRRRKVTRFTYATKKELKRINKKNVINKMNRVELMERLVQYKLSKWEKRNPCPIKQDQGYKDLFEDQFLPQWQEERDKAEEHLREVVISMYHKVRIFACLIERGGGCRTKHVHICNVKDKVNIADYEYGKDITPIQKAYQPEIEKISVKINKLNSKYEIVTGLAIENHKRNRMFVISGHFRAADKKCVCIRRLFTGKFSNSISCNRGAA